MKAKRTHCWILGLIFSEAFVVLVLRDFLTPLPEATRRAFEIFLPGFAWTSPATYVLGVVESFLWGAYIEMLMIPMLRAFAVKHHSSLPGHDAGHAHRHAA